VSFYSINCVANDGIKRHGDEIRIFCAQPKKFLKAPALLIGQLSGKQDSYFFEILHKTHHAFWVPVKDRASLLPN